MVKQQSLNDEQNALKEMQTTVGMKPKLVLSLNTATVD